MYIVPEVVLVGARDLDPPEAEYIAAAGVTHLADAGELPRALQGFRAAYVHVDLDVLDPCECPHVGCPTPGGLALSTLLAAIAAISEQVRPLPIGRARVFLLVFRVFLI